MKINNNILSIPPYISTSWENILSIHKEKALLIVILRNSARIEVPDLSETMMQLIFEAHEKYLESLKNSKPAISFGMPMSGNTMDSITSAMNHDESQRNAPDIPSDVLNKIAQVSKIFSEEINLEIPKPEKNCNCVHCQIAKALQLANGIHPENLDEAVSDEDLSFKLWDIKEEANKLFTVTNPLDKNEYYSVFLGEPIGCTCGSKDCEHIKAVLNS